MVGLSCSCYDDYEYWYHPPSDFTIFSLSRRKRCLSCKDLIGIGKPCLQFECFRNPYDDIEERIWGTEVQTADKYMCEKCGEIFLNLEAVGYCINLGDDMKDLLEDYWDLTGFQPKVKNELQPRTTA